MQDARLRFNKLGAVKYISHLDMYRCFTRAFRRAGIPVWVTEGFNPRVYLNFALPLPLGAESVDDILDTRFTADVSADDLLRLDLYELPEGLWISALEEPAFKTKDIVSASWDITLPADYPVSAATGRLEAGGLTFEKEGKKGKKPVKKTVDLSASIYSWNIDTSSEKPLLSVNVGAGNENNINPFRLFEALSSAVGYEGLPVNVRRTGIFTDIHR